VAGLPAIAGILLGTAAVSSYWTAIAFGVGAGAILQVIIEVAALMVRREGGGALAAPASAGGVIAGLAIMYATALLV
jgi:ZIP family zinc transporter